MDGHINKFSLNPGFNQTKQNNLLMIYIIPMKNKMLWQNWHIILITLTL